MTEAHIHSNSCSCDHGHEHAHDHNPLKIAHRWILTVVIVGILLVSLRGFIIDQMIVRVTSYAASAANSDAIRICHKILAIDPLNKRAWVSLGYAYMDLSRVDWAIPVFEKVIALDPADKGAASFELGQAYYAKGDLLKAITSLERIRSAGPRAAVMLEADILKYRHGNLGFRSLNSMQILLADLLDCYKKTGNVAQAVLIQSEYDLYKNKHSRILF